MSTTQSFFQWYFDGIGGLGGWILFATLAVIAIAYIIADSRWRNVRAYAWLLGAILSALFLFPTILYKFASAALERALEEPFFYLGLMGGIVPCVVAIGYAVANLGRKSEPLSPPLLPPLSPDDVRKQTGEVAPARPLSQSRPRVNAWLVNEDTGQNYQLSEGDMRIGRASDNDLVFAHSSVSREHALVREDRGHFFVLDRGSKSGTLVNRKKIDGTYQLTHNDTLEIGDIRLRFITFLK